MQIMVEVSTKLMVQADTPYLMLSFDSLFGRLRDVISNDWLLGVALARVALQVAYRIASEKYEVQGNTIRIRIDLTVDEAATIMQWWRAISWNIMKLLEHWKEEYPRAKCKSCLEGRIAGLRVVYEILKQIDEVVLHGRA